MRKRLYADTAIPVAFCARQRKQGSSTIINGHCNLKGTVTTPLSDHCLEKPLQKAQHLYMFIVVKALPDTPYELRVQQVIGINFFFS